jgi:hypothetical protein
VSALSSSETYEVREARLHASWAERRRADAIGADCDKWRAQVPQPRQRSTRRVIGTAIRGVGDAYGAAGTGNPQPPPSYRCHTDYIGGMVCDPR